MNQIGRIEESESSSVLNQGNTNNNTEKGKIKNNIIVKRKRRSKHEKEGRNFVCNICEKSYLSQPALNNHKNTKHNVNEGQVEKRARGRPRKYVRILIYNY